MVSCVRRAERHSLPRPERYSGPASMVAGPNGLSVKYCVEPSGKAATSSLNASEAGVDSGPDEAGLTGPRAAQPVNARQKTKKAKRYCSRIILYHSQAVMHGKDAGSPFRATNSEVICFSDDDFPESLKGKKTSVAYVSQLFARNSLFLPGLTDVLSRIY